MSVCFTNDANDDAVTGVGVFVVIMMMNQTRLNFLHTSAVKSFKFKTKKQI